MHQLLYEESGGSRVKVIKALLLGGLRCVCWIPFIPVGILAFVLDIGGDDRLMKWAMDHDPCFWFGVR